MSVYMWYNGGAGDFCGAATIGGTEYPGLIRLLSVDFGVGRNISMQTGNMVDRVNQVPQFSEITIRKAADITSTALFHEGCGGDDGGEKPVEILFFNGDSALDNKPYFTLVLTDVLVSGLSVSADEDSNSVEVVSLSFSKIELKSNSYDQANKGIVPKNAIFDLAKQQR